MVSEERKTRVAELYLKGNPQYLIARDLGCSESQVSKDLAELKTLWRERAAEDRLQRIAEGLAKLDLLERTLWAANLPSLLLRCLDIRFRVLGAYKECVAVIHAPPTAFPWDALASDGCPIEARIAEVAPKPVAQLEERACLQ